MTQLLSDCLFGGVCRRELLGAGVFFRCLRVGFTAAALRVVFCDCAACGAPAQVVITRDFNNLPYSMWSVNNGAFSFDAPVIKCVGEPFTDPTSTGCTRVIVDGLNIGGTGDEGTWLHRLGCGRACVFANVWGRCRVVFQRVALTARAGRGCCSWLHSVHERQPVGR